MLVEQRAARGVEQPQPRLVEQAEGRGGSARSECAGAKGEEGGGGSGGGGSGGGGGQEQGGHHSLMHFFFPDEEQHTHTDPKY